jgi:MFS family permease
VRARQARTARVGVTAIFFANGFSIGAWAVAIPLVKAEYQLSDAQLSLVLLAAGVGAISAMPVAGLAPPKLGGTGRTLTIAGPIAALLLALLPALSGLPGGYAWLAVAALAFGFFNILVDVPMNAHASVIERGWGAAIMSSFHAAWSAGGLFGSALGGLILRRGASASVQLGIEAAIVLAIILIATRSIGVGDTHSGGKIFAKPEPKLVALGVIALLAVFSEAAVTDWSALYLSRELGWSAAAAAGGFSAYASMMFLGRIMGDGIVRRLGRAEVIGYGAAILFAGGGLAVFPDSPWAAVIGFCLVGLGVANMVPAAFSASAAAARTPSMGVAMTASLAYAAYLMGPPLIGAVASVSSLRAAFALLLLAAAAIIALAFGQRSAR